MQYQIIRELPLEIFRAYDIRGIVGESFTEDILYTLGLAIGSENLARGCTSIQVGRDGRISGPSLAKGLITGILATGCDVEDLGMVTTPMVYYAGFTANSNSGVAVSGSHNPPQYNGVKIVLGGDPLFGEAILDLYRRIQEGNFQVGQGHYRERPIDEEYLTAITDTVKLARPLKIAVDCGNGVGGKVASLLFSRLGCEVIPLFCEVDGTFPNHHPDPSVPSNLTTLIDTVINQNCDVGLAFDGDADRVGIVAESGKIIAADRILTLFALDLLTRYKDKPIIFDVKCGRQLEEQILKYGGIPLRYKTGHSLIKAKMRDLGSHLAGELSGHIFMRERWYGFDDGLYVAARFLELLTKQKGNVSSLFAQIPVTCATPELKIAATEQNKFSLVEKLIKYGQFSGQTNTIDGLRIDYSDGFGLIRPSNTTPYLIACFEGDDEVVVKRIQEEFKRELLKIHKELLLPF